MAFDKNNFLTIEEGWPILQDGLDRIIDMIDGVKQDKFTSQEYMTLYTTVFNICLPNSNNPRCHVLYNNHAMVFEDYISSKVLPHLKDKKDEDLLEEVLKRWENHKLMAQWTGRFFHYLDKYFVIGENLPTLQQSTYSIFHKLVLNRQVRDTFMSMFERERNGEQIDRTLVKNFIEMYLELGINYYRDDFEEDLLDGTKKFYSLNASKWIDTYSYQDYMLKAEECLQKERVRADIYLPELTRRRMVKAVEYELIVVHAEEINEKKKMMEKEAVAKKL